MMKKSEHPYYTTTTRDNIPTYLEHEAVNLNVDVLVGFLGVVELVDLHELLQTLPEVQAEEIDPLQAARIQNQLQGVELDVQVGTRDWRSVEYYNYNNIIIVQQHGEGRSESYWGSLSHQESSIL